MIYLLGINDGSISMDPILVDGSINIYKKGSNNRGNIESDKIINMNKAKI